MTRPLQDILDSGAGWITEEELAWIGEYIRELEKGQSKLLTFMHTYVPISDYYRVCEELEECKKLLKEAGHGQEG